jgi:hypothetical protein
MVVESIHQLLDFTLVYKNTRVCVFDDRCYHVAACSALPDSSQYQIATSLKPKNGVFPVCRKCLQLLQYQGYDDIKARKEHYSQQVFERFNLLDFWKQFHLYPVSEKRDMRKPIQSNSS